MTLERFDAAFDEFETSAFRLQVLPQYVTETTKHFDAWKRGESQPQETITTEWNDFVANRVRSGRVMQMVHVIDLPFNDYVRYCLDWWYPHRIAAGEQVLAMKRVEATDLTTDFWLFDEKQAFRMNYDAHGSFEDVTELSEDKVKACMDIRSAVLSKARPFDELAGVVRK